MEFLDGHVGGARSKVVLLRTDGERGPDNLKISELRSENQIWLDFLKGWFVTEPAVAAELRSQPFQPPIEVFTAN